MADSIQGSYETWRIKFPEGYEMFKRYARFVRKDGFKQFSARAIVHRMRWFQLFERTHGEVFKINDHYSSRLARELVEEDESFRGFFNTRQLQRA